MVKTPLSDIEIAQKAVLEPIECIADKLAIPRNELECYGKYKAKVSPRFFEQIAERPNGKLVLVTAVTPTPAGEGKTTTSVGLADALQRIGKKTAVCLREPSLGPCFGMKGGATGGGYAQVVPMEEINLHFTGDFHAITTAHNLLTAVLDNHIHHGNALELDTRKILWNRVMDLNDRALRHIVVGLGGAANSVPRESGFDITVASEVMAILCLSESLQELKQRLGQILIGVTKEGRLVRASELKCHGAMAALLKEALKPNLVQTLEGTPAFVHGGPFANIAHGCNSVIATKMAMKIADFTVTEAGFGADLGAEKFFDIKCRKAGIHPDVVVIVATIRALKMHGGVELANLDHENLNALGNGLANLKKHIENMRRYAVPVIVAINSFPSDTEAEIGLLKKQGSVLNVPIVRADHWANGGAGAEELAKTVAHVAVSEKSDFSPLYPDDLPLWEKVRVIACEIYGASGIIGDKRVVNMFRELEEQGFGKFPVCIAKTQYSFSTNPAEKGCPSGFEVPIRDVRVSAGAGFVVVLTGDIMTMPGLPKVPAAEHIDVDENGNITGLS